MYRDPGYSGPGVPGNGRLCRNRELRLFGHKKSETETAKSNRIITSDTMRNGACNTVTGLVRSILLTQKVWTAQFCTEGRYDNYTEIHRVLQEGGAYKTVPATEDALQTARTAQYKC
eukprot:927056-Rhodomonas_salina.3